MIAQISAKINDINEKIEIPNEITLAAFAESEEMVKNNSGREFASVEEMRKSVSEE
ncbi:MAG: hypothetical protein LBI36_05605 [Oscillospiraceae bacterium]|jgi:hypothetical protein|nr:hypothetical protein [Oscillospiraceae bacterium]